MVIIAYVIPDEPADVQEKIQREDYIVQEIMTKARKTHVSAKQSVESTQVRRPSRLITNVVK